MKKMLNSKRGEMYIEAIVTLIILMAVFLFALSSLGVATDKSTADHIADTLLETAVFYGAFGDEFDAKVEELKELYSGLEFDVSVEGDWYNTTLKRVQLGDTMTVTVSYNVQLSGFGSLIKIPLTSVRTGASENYWKT